MTDNLPLVTFALLSYNQEKYIEEAVSAALAQNYPNLEILISDDCSCDRTFEIIQELVESNKGGHNVIINRNVENLGLASHINSVVKRANGEIIVLAAGDDVSLNDRVSRSVHYLLNEKNAQFVSFTDIIINEDSDIRKANSARGGKCRVVTLDNFIRSRSERMSGASRAIYKKAFLDFPPLNKNCPTEDTPTILRLLMKGVGIIAPEPGIYHRKHSANLSGKMSINRMNFEEIRNQYESDAEYALGMNIIGEVSYLKILEWAKRDYELRCLYRDHQNSARKISFSFSSYIGSRNISFLRFLELIRRSI